MQQSPNNTDPARPVTHYGKVIELAEKANNPKQDRLFGYQGILFRGDSRPVRRVNQAGGLNGRTDLGVPQNRLEAQGLLISAGAGATGWSGCSMAKEFWGCVNYMASNSSDGHIYIVDSRLIPAKEAAYDLEAILIENKYPRRDVGSEVNVTDAPMNAVIGWIDVPKADGILNRNLSREAQAILKEIKIDYVTFNPAYVPPQA
jgi:hypothetical protein